MFKIINKFIRRFKHILFGYNDKILVISDGKKQKMSYPNFIYFSVEEHFYLHKLDGPSVYYPNGDIGFYYKNEFVDVDNQKDFNKHIKLLCLK